MGDASRARSYREEAEYRVLAVKTHDEVIQWELTALALEFDLLAKQASRRQRAGEPG